MRGGGMVGGTTSMIWMAGGACKPCREACEDKEIRKENRFCLQVSANVEDEKQFQ